MSDSYERVLAVANRTADFRGHTLSKWHAQDGFPYWDNSGMNEGTPATRYLNRCLTCGQGVIVLMQPDQTIQMSGRAIELHCTKGQEQRRYRPDQVTEQLIETHRILFCVVMDEGIAERHRISQVYALNVIGYLADLLSNQGWNVHGMIEDYKRQLAEGSTGL